MVPGAKSKFGAPCSNMRSFGSKSTVMKKVLVTLLGLFGASHSHSATPAVIRHPGNCAPLLPIILHLDTNKHSSKVEYINWIVSELSVGVHKMLNRTGRTCISFL